MGFQGFVRAFFFQTLLVRQSRCSHLFASRDCCPSKGTFPSLKTMGTIYFYMPLDMKSGGPADTHWFHGSLGKLGYKTKMFKINEEYNDDSLTFTPLTHESFENLVFQKSDLLVVGELVKFSNTEWVLSSGAKIVRWLQGVHPDTEFYGYNDANGASASHPNWNEPLHRLASNHWIHAQFYCPGFPIDPPLEQVFYTRTNNGKRNWDTYKRRGADDESPNWVLIDADFNRLFDFNLEEFREMLETLIGLEEASTGRSIGRFNIVGLKNYSREEVIDLYKSARVIVDMFTPGKERMNYEAALFDVCVIVADYMSGEDIVDFPIDVGRLIPYNATDTAVKVFNGVYHYFKLGAGVSKSPCHGGGSAQLKSLGTELRTSSIIEADRYVRSRHFKFVTFATTRGQFRALWPFLCSIIVTHPLAEVEVWVENTSPYFLDMYGGGTPTRSTLAAFGLLKNVRFMEIPATIATPGDGRVLLEYLLSQKTFLMGVAPYVLWVPLLNTFTTLVIGNEFLNSLVYDLEEIKSPTMAILLVRVEGIVENEQNVYFFKSEVAFQEGMIKYDNTVKTCGTGFDCSASDLIRFSSTQSRLNDCQKDKLKSLVQHPVFRLCGKSCEV